MSKAKLTKKVHESLEGMTLAGSKEVVDIIYNEMQNIIKEDGELYIDGIGTFKIIERAGRTGRNPKTGEPIEIGAKKLLKFRSARGIKQLINTSPSKKKTTKVTKKA